MKKGDKLFDYIKTKTISYFLPSLASLVLYFIFIVILVNQFDFFFTERIFTHLLFFTLSLPVSIITLFIFSIVMSYPFDKLKNKYWSKRSNKELFLIRTLYMSIIMPLYFEINLFIVAGYFGWIGFKGF